MYLCSLHSDERAGEFLAAEAAGEFFFSIAIISGKKTQVFFLFVE